MRRVLAVCGVLVALAVVAAVLDPGVDPHFQVARARTFAACSSSDCGPYAETLTWSDLGFPSTTGYNVTCSTTGGSCPGSPYAAPSRFYTFTGLDCGTTFTLGVQAHNGSGGTSSTFTTAYSTPSCPTVGATVVGTAGSPTPACTTTVALNGDVDGALTSGGANAVVCLASGTWTEIDLSSTHTAANVTLRSATPGGAHIAGLKLFGASSNLTIEGLTMSDGIEFLNTTNNDVAQYNTLEGWTSADAQLSSAFLEFPGDEGTSTATVTMSFNQIDNVPQCWQDDSSGGSIFSHNVCGPGLGNGGSTDVHYTQSEDDNETLDNNAFEGPLAASATGHINVSHLSGATGKFDNNILWHVQGDQHLEWNDDGASTALEVNNNLDVEDTTGTNGFGPGAFEQIANNFTLGGFTQDNDTVVGVSGETASDYTIEGSPTSCTVSDNIGITNPSSGSYAVAAGCTSSSNVSDDGTAPGTGGAHSWTPSWQSTTWTPTNGSPWSPPPSTYYKPVAGAGVTSAMGYQGTIGP